MRNFGFAAIFVLAAAAAHGQARNVTLIVPGSADPWLAGQPAGGTASAGDTAPAQSPVQVTGVPITPGQPVRFYATGRISTQPGAAPDGPIGNIAQIVSHLGGQENAISNITAPLGALVGVFLTDELPLFRPVPPGLDFTSAVSRNYLSLAPQIQQVFYIGDGRAGGNLQQVVPPPGATRLFLGSMDSSRWVNHTGAFTVIVETIVPATGAVCTFTPRNLLLPFHHSAAHLAGLFPDHFVAVNVSLEGSAAGGVSVTINASRAIFTLNSGSPASLSAVVSATDVAGRAIFSVNPPTPFGSQRTDLTAQGSAGGRDFRCTGTLVTGIGFGVENIASVVSGGLSGSSSIAQLLEKPHARFERHWLEIIRIAMEDPDLRERGAAALREFGPALGQLMAGEPIEIDPARAKELGALVARFSAAASPELRALIDELRGKARVIAAATPPSSQPVSAPASTVAARKLLAKMPIVFEPGREHGYVARGPGFRLSLSAQDASLSTGTGEVLRMRFEGTRSDVRLLPIDALPGRSNYLHGNQPARWRRDVPQYARVKYENIYPGVDAVFHGSGGELEFDFVVAPGADTSRIAISFDGAAPIYLDAEGDSIVRYGAAQFRLRKPVLYQETAGVRRPAEGRYVLLAGNRLAFEIGDYDRTRPLVIDPVLSYASYLGGGKDDSGLAIAVDALGNTYIAGATGSTFGGTATSLRPAGSLLSNGDAFVIKLNPEATAPVYTTFIGGTGHSGALAIAVDLNGNAYVTGSTDASDFPVAQPFQRNFAGGTRSLGTDAFVLKLNPAGSTLLYSTYLGGAGGDIGRGIAVDPLGHAYVAGLTASPNFPLAIPLQSAFRGGRRLGCDAFLSKLNPTGTQLVYSTLFGGSEDDVASGVAVDPAGNAYVTGVTYSTDYPVRNALLPAPRGGADAFLTAINAAGNAYLYSTYLGGSSDDIATAIAVDRSSSVYLTGITGSADFPIVNAVQPRPGADNLLGFDAFVMKLTSDNGGIAFSTYLGGSGNDAGFAIAVAADGSVLVGGETDSTNFPLAAPLQTAFGGLIDGFVTKLNPAGSAILYSTFSGGTGYDSVAALAVDASGAVYTAGSSTSADLPVNFGTFQADNQGRSDVVVMKLADGTATNAVVTVSAASIKIGPVAPDSIVSAFGAGLAASFERALTLPLPTALGGIAVRVKDSAGVERAASLYAAASTQVNFLIPPDSANGVAQVTVTGAGGATLATGTVRIASVAPSLFTANASGQGVAAAIATRISADSTTASGLVFQCGTAPGSCVGAPIDVDTPGDNIFVSLFGTGIKRRSSIAAVKATIAGQDVPVSFAGAQSESPGLDQVNIGPLPRTLAGRGVADLVLTVDGRASNPVTLTIR